MPRSCGFPPASGNAWRWSARLSLASPVLLLDEPTGALDQESTERVEVLLRERIAAGTTIVMVTHSDQQAQRLGHRHLVMQLTLRP